MTCAGWWCVRRKRKVSYTTMCTMMDENACTIVYAKTQKKLRPDSFEQETLY